MRNQRWWELAAGLAGGLLGTGLMLAGMKRAGKLPRAWRPVAAAKDPGDFMVSLAERFVHRELPEAAHRGLARSLYWAYGSVWPVGLAALAGRLGVRSPARALGAGALLGALVWGVGALGWLPAAGLAPPINRQPPRAALSNLLGHVAYGAVAAAPLALETATRSPV